MPDEASITIKVVTRHGPLYFTVADPKFGHFSATMTVLRVLRQLGLDFTILQVMKHTSGTINQQVSISKDDEIFGGKAIFAATGRLVEYKALEVANALLAGRKSVTRREWSNKYAEGFHKGDMIQAYNRSPRHGGERIAYIALTQDPYKQLTTDMSDEDYDREGFKYFAENPEVEVPKTFAPEDGDWLEHFNAWRRDAQYLWVIRFELLP